jgi:cysteine-rich repeat protein
MTPLIAGPGSPSRTCALHCTKTAAITTLFVLLASFVAPPPASADLTPRIVNGVLTHGYPAVGAVLRGDFPNWNQHVPITADTASMFCSGTLIGCHTFLHRRALYEDRVYGEGDYHLTATIFGGAPPVCGNGSTEFNEQCDDGNTADGDCCTADCRFEPQGTSRGTRRLCDGAGQCMPTPCTGDCNGNDEVTVDELITMVNMALGSTAVACDSGDVNGNGEIMVDEIITAVNRALVGCS